MVINAPNAPGPSTFIGGRRTQSHWRSTQSWRGSSERSFAQWMIFGMPKISLLRKPSKRTWMRVQVQARILRLSPYWTPNLQPVPHHGHHLFLSICFLYLLHDCQVPVCREQFFLRLMQIKVCWQWSVNGREGKQPIPWSELGAHQLWKSMIFF